MFFGFDPIDFLFLAPGFLLAFWAQMRVHSAYHEGSRFPSSSGVTGARTAAEVLRAEGIADVAIEAGPGQLTAQDDPAHRVLRLSEGVDASPSLAALEIAAHESSHALPHPDTPLLFVPFRPARWSPQR